MRFFEVYAVNKPELKTDKLFSGTPSAAAKKAMTAMCKDVSGTCSLTVTMREVKRTMSSGQYMTIPVKDSDNMPIMRKYKLKRTLNETPVVFEGATPITFRYKVDIVESFGRVA
jgi:hypothetical protein